MKKIFVLFVISVMLCTSCIAGSAADYYNNDSSKNTSLKAEFEYVVANDVLVKKYLSEQEISFYRNIISIKEDNPDLDSDKIAKLLLSTMPYHTRATRSIGESTGIWNLTDAELLLIVKHPIQALKVNACKDSADLWTNEMYPNWTDGDEGNAYRHAFWNAMMASEIGVILAQEFASAHENHGLTDAEYRQIVINGFNGLEHKQMDLYNNNIGRTKAYPNNGETDIHYKLVKLIRNNSLRILVK